MAERKPARKTAPKAARRAVARRAVATPDGAEGFTPEERAAMRDRARELRAAKRARPGESRAESDASAVMAAIAAMEPPDRAIGERLHAIVTASAPGLAPRLWYGMPAYARDGQVLCFFQAAHKFRTRYATLGFTDKAALDDGRMWPTSFALAELGADAEARIAALVKRAAGA